MSHPRRTLALPPRFVGALLVAALMAGCTAPATVPGTPGSASDRDVMHLLPADALLLGEQHDATEHHAIELSAVKSLAERGRLAALALEMADDSTTTAYLQPDATEAQVQTALSWNDKAWPWEAYGPTVMVAVRAGVPVVGANLPRERMRDAMADVSLDVQLSPEALEAQKDAVRAGHCNLLPESQIGPMTRIQVARDRSMAQAIVKARAQGKTVVLISGAGHATRLLGVPQHLPSDLSVKAVRMQAGTADESAKPGTYDAVWTTSALPDKDYCAGVRRAS